MLQWLTGSADEDPACPTRDHDQDGDIDLRHLPDLQSGFGGYSSCWQRARCEGRLAWRSSNMCVAGCESQINSLET